MPANVYKDRVIELEDNVYEIEQELYNYSIIQKTFKHLADILNIDVKIIKKNDKLKKGFLSKQVRKSSFEKIIQRENVENNNTEMIIFDLQKLIKVLDSKIGLQILNVGKDLKYKLDQSNNSKCSISSMDKIELIKSPKDESNEQKKEIKMDFKINNLDLKKKLKIKKLINEIKKNDIIYILDKIRKFKKQFDSHNILITQNELKIDGLDIRYSLTNYFKSDQNNRPYSNFQPNDVINRPSDEFASEIDFANNNQILCLNFIYNSETFYEELLKNLKDFKISSKIKNAKIFLNTNHKEIFKHYIQSNLQILFHKINHLKTVRDLKHKEKNQVCQVANDFFYDQNIVNSLTENFNKIEDYYLTKVLRFLKPRRRINSNLDLKQGSQLNPCYLYDQYSPLCLKLFSNDPIKAISRRLK